MGFNDEPMIKQKEYSAEKKKIKRAKSLSVAKRVIVMGNIGSIAGVNMVVSLVMFLVLMIGTSAFPYFSHIQIDFSAQTFNMRGGFFLTMCCIFLVIFTVSMFWYVIAYKRLEIMCIHLDGELPGALEVNELAQKEYFQNKMADIAGLMPSKFSSLSGPDGVAMNYLLWNEERGINIKVFKIINSILICGQILLAALFVCILI